jgi:hypothetical protein
VLVAVSARRAARGRALHARVVEAMTDGER